MSPLCSQRFNPCPISTRNRPLHAINVPDAGKHKIKMLARLLRRGRQRLTDDGECRSLLWCNLAKASRDRAALCCASLGVKIMPPFGPPPAGTDRPLAAGVGP